MGISVDMSFEVEQYQPQKSVAVRRLEILLSHLYSQQLDIEPTFTSYSCESGPAILEAKNSRRIKSQLYVPSSSRSKYLGLAEDEKTRLLFLEPGGPEDELRCRLKHVRALKDHQYEALSYAWGLSDGQHTISQAAQEISITANLDVALRQLRYPDRGRLLWVDAICINQADKAERSRQVRIMQEIYASASRVLVWLGEESESDADAFRSLISIINLKVERTAGRFPVQLGWYRDKSDKVLSGGVHRALLTDIEYEHVVNLLRREWFRRNWIIQEAASASHAIVVCGNGSMSWELFAEAYMKLGDDFLPIDQFGGQDAHHALEIISAIEQARRARSGPLTMSLFHILLATCKSECRDQRDKIYAVIGLAKDWTEKKMLAPDYEISEEKVLQLFKQFAVFDTKHHRSLRILSCASGPRFRRVPWSLPSWVPDWRKLDNSHPFVRYSDRTQFCASGRMSPVAWYSKTNDILNVTGKEIDRIALLGPSSAFSKSIAIFEINEKKIADLEASANWLQGCQKLALGGSQYMTAERQQHFWKTMTCGLTGEGFPAPEYYSDYLEDYIKFLVSAPNLFHEFMTESKALEKGFRGANEVAPNFQRHALIEASLSRWASRRRFCRTQRGRLAFVPQNSLRGDIITVIFGGEVPYVLRPLNNVWYSVVGECYVDGVMFGEGLSEDSGEKVFQLW